MNRFGSVVRTIISLAIVAGGAYGAYWMGTPQVPTRPPSRGGAPLVQTVAAQEHTEGIQFEVDGVVVPFRQIDIAAQVSGSIVYKAANCRTGRIVQLDEVLIRIDPRDYELEVTRLEEELEQADAMIRELQLEITTAENQIVLATQQLEIDARQLDRNLRLSTTSAVSQTELDTARRAELTTRNTLQSLQDNRNLLNQRLVRMDSGKALVEANLQKARLALERTEIRAPLEGIIVSENVEQDGYIQAGSTLITLQDTSQLDVACKLHMRQMHWLWQSAAAQQGKELPSVDEELETLTSVEAFDFPATPATVIYRLGSTDFQWDGMLDRFDGAGIDNQTRMIPCRVHVDRPADVTVVMGEDDVANLGAKPPTLMTGMFVKVRITARPPIPLIRIPQQAIQPGNVVWAVVDGKLQRHDARVATSARDYVVAYQQAGGLQAGKSIVISPLATAAEGMSVREGGKE